MRVRDFVKLEISLPVLLLALVPQLVQADEPNQPSPNTSFSDVKLVLENYCYGCHGYGETEGDVSLEGFVESDNPTLDHQGWLAVWRNLRAQTMPPADQDQPTKEEAALVGAWIERSVFKLDPEKPDPGRVTIRRMNRAEYTYTISDLFGYNFKATESFPADDTGYGFDTIGDVLTISPLLMEKYFDAASEIVEAIVDTSGPDNPSFTVWANSFSNEAKPDASVESMPLNQEAKFLAKRWIEHAGEYRFKVELQLENLERGTTSTGHLVLKSEDRELGKMPLGWDQRLVADFETTAKLDKGHFLFNLVMQPGDSAAEGQEIPKLRIKKISVEGPLDGSQATHPKEYTKIFFDGPPPKDEQGQRAYAVKLIEHYGTLAYRRPIDANTRDRLVDMMMGVSQRDGRSFEEGFAMALTAILSSPRFIFRAEIQPEPNNPAAVVPVDEFALASRLSYFLWSSTPDEELMQLAGEGKLREQLGAQVDRMIADKKSQRFIERFVGQWLGASDVETMNIDARRILGIQDAAEANRVFSRTVRKAMRDETEMMFAEILRENLPVLDFLNANYTFLNEPLASFYGLEGLGVSGNEMQKVTLPEDSVRGGILTQGTFLVTSSNPTRTSPVKRGLFILDNILGTPAPPAPPDVPELEEVRSRGKKLTMRQQMELHREAPMCKSCHQRMDPLGLALENFSAIGQFRTAEGDEKIDPRGKLITGEEFEDIRQLTKILSSERKTDFYRCLTEKLLTYALGRGMEYYDTPTIDQIVETLEQEPNNGKMRGLIHAIVNSPPFQLRRGDGSLLSQN